MTREQIRLREQRRPRSRRAGSLPGRRFALVGALTLCLVGGWAALATADSSPEIVTATVYQAGGTTTDSVSLADLQANPRQCPQYPGQTMNEVNREGSTSVTLPPPGPQTGTWALATILKCMHTPISLGHVTGVTVISASGTPEAGPNSQLTPADLATPSDFNDSAQLPVIEDLGSTTQYDRPWRGTVNGRPDYNYLDEVPQSGPINIDVFEGPRLKVTATASRTSVNAGGTVNFAASVSPADPAGLTYSWSFDGGAANLSGASPQVKFTSAGQYDVTVQATDEAGGGGAAAIPITVTSRTHTPPAKGNGANTGPQHSSGNTPGGRAGKNTKSQGAGGGQGQSGNGTTGGGKGNDSSSANSANAVSGNGNGTADGQAKNGNAPTGRQPVPGPKPANGQPNRAPGSGLQTPRVQGLLISDVTPLPLASSALARPRQGRAATAPALRTPGDDSPLPAIIAGVAILLLLCLGAGRELGWRRRWRPLRFGS